MHEVEYFNVQNGLERPFMRTANITQIGHPLAGRVDRFYVARKHGINVITIGQGSMVRGGAGADGPPLNLFNNIEGVRLFKHLNGQMRDAVGR